MQLPFSKQMVTAALIVILAPAATVIGAQSFSDFVATPQPYVIAQEMVGPSPGGQPGTMPGTGEAAGPTPVAQPNQPSGNLQPQPSPVSQPGPQPSGQPVQPPGGEVVGPSPGPQPMIPPSDQPRLPVIRPCPATPVIECPPDSESTFETNLDGCSIRKCIPRGSDDRPKPPGNWTCPAPPPNMKCEEVGKYPNGCNRFKCTPVEDRRESPRPPPALEQCAREAIGNETYEQMITGKLQLTEEQKRLVGEKCQQFKRPGRGEGFDRAPGAQDSERRTCRINGVEMPGPCPESSGPGGPMMGGPGGGEGGMMSPGEFGPSEEDMERMEKERKTRVLQDMKRGLRGMEQGLRMMERGISSCRKAKMDTTEPEAALAKIKEIIAKVKTAEDPDELMDIMQELPELFDGAREHVEACHRLAELPRITKQIGREVKQLENEQRRLVSQVKRAKLDLTDQLNGIAAGIATVKEILAEVNRVKTVDEFEAATEKLEGLRETFEDLHEKMDAVRSVLNIKRAITDAKREIRNTERFISSLKRKGVDASELAEMVAAGKTLVAELETLAKQKPLDIDAIHEQFELLMELGQRAEELMDQLRGKKTERGFEGRFGRSPVESVKLPDTFRQFEKKESEEADSSELESLLGF